MKKVALTVGLIFAVTHFAPFSQPSWAAPKKGKAQKEEPAKVEPKKEEAVAPNVEATPAPEAAATPEPAATPSVAPTEEAKPVEKVAPPKKSSKWPRRGHKYWRDGKFIWGEPVGGAVEIPDEKKPEAKVDEKDLNRFDKGAGDHRVRSRWPEDPL